MASIVAEMQTLDYNPIVLYKQQGEEPSQECKMLNNQDFFISYSDRISERHANQTW